MRTRRHGKWQKAFRNFRHRLRPGASILRYHRIADLGSDPHPVCVSPAHFAEQLEVLKKNSHVLSLQRFNQALRNGRIPPGAVVITVDDGYADNLYQGKPLLERFDLPATVFITTGHLGVPREFWWDKLEQIFLQPGTLPDRLSLTVGATRHEWQLRDACNYGEDDVHRHRAWNLSLGNDPSPRHRLYRDLHRLLKPMAAVEQERILHDLCAWAGRKATARESHRFLAPEEINRLAYGGLIEVGAHTVTHPILSPLSEAPQRDEILSSKTQLEDILGSPVTSFAYPYGSRRDYSKETVAIVRDAGFECACTTTADVIFNHDDPFELPRIYVGNWPADEFAQRLGWSV